MSKKTTKLEEHILAELWENAVFNNEAYNLLEKYAENISKKSKRDVILFQQNSRFILSTIRNRNLIYKDEQEKLQNTVVAFFGLSVGSHAAITWMMESRANQIKIIDHDRISPSNLNRLRFGWDSIGKLKTQVVKNQLISIHPDTHVISSSNTHLNSLEKFLNKSPHTNIIVDAIDDMQAKVLLRIWARDNHIPLISAADVGDNILLDVERYDLNPQPKLFLGRIKNIENIDFSTLSDIERKQLVIKLIGFEKNSLAMLESLLSIGKSLATWPQLGATATIAGGIIATTIKKIMLGEKVLSNRYYISLDDILVQNTNNQNEAKNAAITQIEKMLKIN